MGAEVPPLVPGEVRAVLLIGVLDVRDEAQEHRRRLTIINRTHCSSHTNITNQNDYNNT